MYASSDIVALFSAGVQPVLRGGAVLQQKGQPGGHLLMTRGLCWGRRVRSLYQGL
jgi:hypothetical protein